MYLQDLGVNFLLILSEKEIIFYDVRCGSSNFWLLNFFYQKFGFNMDTFTLTSVPFPIAF